MLYTEKKTVDIIEVAGVSLPQELGKEMFDKAKAFIEQYTKVGQTLSYLINQLNDHQIDFARATETQDNSILPAGLSFRNYWYRFGNDVQEVALLQCVVRTLTDLETH